MNQQEAIQRVLERVNAARAEAITSFEGEYRFLSNFYRTPVPYKNYIWVTAEHAYQAMKTFDREQRAEIARARTPSHAKILGRRVTLRCNWDGIKLRIVKEILLAKFYPGRENTNKLLATGEAELIEGNWWGDRYWGVCGGEGENHLGRLLMEVRGLRGI